MDDHERRHAGNDRRQAVPAAGARVEGRDHRSEQRHREKRVKGVERGDHRREYEGERDAGAGADDGSYTSGANELRVRCAQD